MEKQEKPSFGHRIEYVLVRITVFVVGLLPIRCALSLGAFMGWFAWKVLRIRRSIVLVNLELAFPEKSREELKRIALLSFKNSGRFMIEFARQWKMDQSYIEKHIRIDNPEALEVLLREKGAIIITGHFGNWELFGIANKYLLGDVAFLVGRQSNSLVDGFINHMRSMHGIELYNRRAAVKGVLSSMKRGGYVCWLSDQDAGDSGIIVNFFDYPASTPRGAAAFSAKIGVPVVLAALLRIGKGPDHRLVIKEPIRPEGDISREEAEERITQQYTLELERLIRESPELYWWAHRRWKTTGLYKDRT
ncbi:MAG: hypothetical protein KAT47_02890 [Candidatus Aegiribacteria sp.]|nr:hypothetical protein [Candidatus Aegiribacteria sp.]